MQVFRSQPRVFCLSIIFLGDCKARFIRWDRSGGIISELFDMLDTEYVTEFLWRMHHASREDLGLDPTVTVASEDEAKGARTALKEWTRIPKNHGFMTPPRENAQMWKVQVFEDRKRPFVENENADDSASESGGCELKDEKPSTPRTFITTRHQFCSDSLTGRATSGYYGVELLEPGPNGRNFGKPVFFKDSWRIAEEGIEKEGDTYDALWRAGVKNISPVTCAGDVWSGDQKQTTRTPDFATQTKEHPWICGPTTVPTPQGDPVTKIIHHVHYRIVLSYIGKPITSFDSTWDLCNAIHCAIIAHRLALEIAKYLHRDISCGNILFTPWGPILIVWDLSRNTLSELWARRTWRTGTWQFMSAALLLRRRKNQQPRDDFESFLWALLYNVLRYRPTSVKGPDLQVLIYDTFDEVSPGKKGGKGKLHFFDARNFEYTDVENSNLPIPLKNILEDLRALFKPLYFAAPLHRLSSTERDLLNKANELTSNSEAIEKIFEDNLALPGWFSNDKAEDQLPQANRLPLTD
ncbi:hypothetical protein OF83DRAFT_1245226, partial [Amylostereum chailletii]